MLVMGMHFGIQRDEEKRRKKEIVLGYLTDHMKVSAAHICNIHNNVSKDVISQISKQRRASDDQANLDVNCVRCTICIHIVWSMAVWLMCSIGCVFVVVGHSFVP